MTSTQGTALPAYEEPILPLHRNCLDELIGKVPKTHDKIAAHIADALKCLTESASELGSLTRVDGPDDPTKAARVKKLAELEASARALSDASTRLKQSKQVVSTLINDEQTCLEEAEAAGYQRRNRDRMAGTQRDEDEDAEGVVRSRVGVHEGIWGRYKSHCEELDEAYQEKSDKEKCAALPQPNDW
jgi:hypothetical protein